MNRPSFFFIYISCLLFTVACADSSQAVPDLPQEEPSNSSVEKARPTWVQQIESAHGKEAVLQFDSVAFDIELYFGGTLRLDGRLTLATNSTWGKIEMANGDFIHYNGNEVLHSPTIDSTRARFAAYTWSYFFLFPYKLSDPGTHWQDFEKKELNGQTYEVEKLTFGPGIGDAPEDWYVTYADSKTKLLEAAAYIVTAGSSVEEAEEDPHAIRYYNYREVSGIPIAHNWSFWGWTEKDGLTKQLGQATLSNIELK